MSKQADKAGPKPSVPYWHLYVDARASAINRNAR